MLADGQAYWGVCAACYCYRRNWIASYSFALQSSGCYGLIALLLPCHWQMSSVVTQVFSRQNTKSSLWACGLLQAASTNRVQIFLPVIIEGKPYNLLVFNMSRGSLNGTLL